MGAAPQARRIHQVLTKDPGGLVCRSSLLLVLIGTAAARGAQLGWGLAPIVSHSHTQLTSGQHRGHFSDEEVEVH